MPGLQLSSNQPMAPWTTLGVGGPARWVAAAADALELADALDFAHEHDLPVLVLGGGSNLLVADSGYDGMVLRYSASALSQSDDGDSALWRVEAGHAWDDVVARAVAEGHAGIECLSGIPGLVGAAPMQNIGAYGQEIADVLASVGVVDLRSGRAQRLAAASCGLAYRTSHFKKRWSGRYLVTDVELRLRPHQPATLRYPELQERWRREGGARAPTLQEARALVLAIRREKSMVLDADDPNRRSAGSFFTNPIVSSTTADAVSERASRNAGRAVSMPRFAAGSDRVKLSAAWLIEQAGFHRGYVSGNVGLSTRHVLALVNRGGATAADIVTLALAIRRAVEDRLGVALVPEPVLVGFGAEVERQLLSPGG